MRNPHVLLLSVAVVIFSCFAVFYFWGTELTKFSGRSSEYALLEDTLSTEDQKGIAYFAFGDFSALDSDSLRVSASPWKLSTAALALAAADGELNDISTDQVPHIFRQYGFHFPERIGNWPEDLAAPELLWPLGQNVGYAKGHMLPIGVTIGNIGCAACHSSVMYTADGSPDLDRVWLGMPNGSINLEAYTQALFQAMLDYGVNTELMLAAVDRLYPETSLSEAFTLRWFILPEMKALIAKRNSEFGRLLPFRTSLAGATNGLDSLKRRLGLIPEGAVLTESIFNSVPDLGGRLWRTKLLNTGTYAIPNIDRNATIWPADIDEGHRRDLAGIIAYFTVPSMGVKTEVALTSIEPSLWITRWMQHYKPQPFPGDIDRALLPLGKQVYAQNCASCHGTYSDNLDAPELLSFPNWEGNVGTDPQRALLLTKEIADTVNSSLFGQHISARTVTSYTAPPLTGIWASAPYFHNGSVPTLWHLMNPESRPTRFKVGGHRLDLDLVGIAGIDDGEGGWLPPDDHSPWSIPADVDTNAFGLSKSGHEQEFVHLSEDQKLALLEYLKLL